MRPRAQQDGQKPGRVGLPGLALDLFHLMYNERPER